MECRFCPQKGTETCLPDINYIIIICASTVLRTEYVLIIISRLQTLDDFDDHLISIEYPDQPRRSRILFFFFAFFLPADIIPALILRTQCRWTWPGHRGQKKRRRKRNQEKKRNHHLRACKAYGPGEVGSAAGICGSSEASVSSYVGRLVWRSRLHVFRQG